MTASQVPTLYEWAGGIDRIRALFQAFHARVPSDPVLSPVFPEFRSALVGYLEWGSRVP